MKKITRVRIIIPLNQVQLYNPLQTYKSYKQCLHLLNKTLTHL